MRPSESKRRSEADGSTLSGREQDRTESETNFIWFLCKAILCNSAAEAPERVQSVYVKRRQGIKTLGHGLELSLELT